MGRPMFPTSECPTSQQRAEGQWSRAPIEQTALELNLQIKPTRRLKRPKPDQLTDGHSFSILNVLDGLNREGLEI